MAPKDTPGPVLAKLRAAVGEILASPDTGEKMRTLGMEPGNSDAPALAKLIASDIERWRGVAKTAGIQPQ